MLAHLPRSLPTCRYKDRRVRTVLACLAILLLARAASAEPVSFDRDVMAVLSKAGCNFGACHANQNGKGGLKLSLRGEDPAADHAALVRSVDGRRVNLLDPDSSLILLKPTCQVAHQGGLRFARESDEFAILRAWIAAGAPGPDPKLPRPIRLEAIPAEAVVVEPQESVQLRVAVHFADGTSRDVTTRACYEATNRHVTVSHGGLVERERLGETTVIVRYLNVQTPVRLAFIAARPDFAWHGPAPVNFIDELVFDKLRTLRMNPSDVCDDATFVRRAMLDCIGLLPTADEARQFVADPAPDKRARLIDHLVTRHEFAEHWALKWSDLLRNEEKVLDPKGVDAFYTWIRDSLAAGKPIDQFVRELVAARGSTYQVPPANFYRANRDPLTRGETAARLFLGVRLQCARCHNHPYDRWTQDDYYNWAAVFGGIDYEMPGATRKDKFDKNEFIGEQIVVVKDQKDVPNPRTGKSASPKFLGAKTPRLADDDDRLERLGEWLASPDNDLFVRSQANFVWYQLIGRGLVEPVDDFRATNPPSHPALLAALAKDFAAGGFDLRELVRTIMTSRTYQLAAEPNETNRDDESNFSRAIVRRLSAEKLFDAQCRVLDLAADFNGYPAGTRAGQLRGANRVRARDQAPSPADRFLKTFGKPERLLACDCERSSDTTLKQAFTLIGDEGLNELLTSDKNRLSRLVDSGRPSAEIIADLYWSALSRPPTAAESAAAEALLADSGGNQLTALQDLAWALLNSKEFVFRH
jgi:hypothetical protein